MNPEKSTVPNSPLLATDVSATPLDQAVAFQTPQVPMQFAARTRPFFRQRQVERNAEHLLAGEAGVLGAGTNASEKPQPAGVADANATPEGGEQSEEVASAATGAASESGPTESSGMESQPDLTVHDLLAQADTTPAGSSGGSGSSAGSAAVERGESGFGPAGLIAGLALGAVALASGSGGSSPAPAEDESTSGVVLDGYLSGATVYADSDRDGDLDEDEDSTTTDEDGEFAFEDEVEGPLVAFGGTDISTGLPFIGVLKAPEGANVVSPLTTLMALLMDEGSSAAEAQDLVLAAVGLESLDGSLNLLTFDPLQAAGSSTPAQAEAGLAIYAAGVMVSTLVSNLTAGILEAGGVDDENGPAIAGDIFELIAARLADGVLTDEGIGELAGLIWDDVVASDTLGGIDVAPLMDDFTPGRQAFAESMEGLLGALQSADDVTEVADAQKASQTSVKLLNASIDGLGDTITLYFDQPLDTGNAPTVDQFIVDNGGAQVIESLQVVNNQVVLRLAEPLSGEQPVKVSFTDNAANDDALTLQDRSGIDAQSFYEVMVENRLLLDENQSGAFAHAGTVELAGAEISAFDPESQRLFVTSFAGLQVVTVNDDLEMALSATIELGSNDINSVAVKNGIVAVAVAAEDKTQPGTVYFLDASGNPESPDFILGSVQVGALPDMVTFSADGLTLLVANEGEQDAEGNNPEGSVSIIDLSGGPAAATVKTASFSAFNDKIDELKAAGVRLFAGEEGFEAISVAQDLEPEYISIAPDGKTAFVTLQENNAIGILDLESGEFVDVVPLGLKSFLGLAMDGSDRDGEGASRAINLQTDNPVFGQYMPDSIASFQGSDGKNYFVIANEGDDRNDFIDPAETASVSSRDLDETAFPDAAALQANTGIGRLNVSNAPGNNGDLDGDGDIDQLLMYGARSFTILDESGRVVFDSGSHVEQFVATSGLFTGADGAGLFDDGRSDNKGPEPEGIAIGHVGDRTLAFVGLERGGGGVMVYDVTDPGSVTFMQYLRNAGDESPEGLTFVAQEDSPTGRELLFVTHEVSNTVTVFQNKTFTLQLLHLSDGEAGMLASSTAPNLAALVDVFEDQYLHSITLSGGDNFLPGPFLAAGTDTSVIDEINAVSGSTLAANATVPIAAVDTLIHNLIGVEASTIGNHEFDLGSQAFRDSFTPSATYVGANFPYLSANLDFAGDSALAPRFTDTVAGEGLELANSLKGRIVPSAVLVENGEKIGLVGATTQLLEAISSPSGTEVKGFPGGQGANGEFDDMDLLAAQLQPVIDDLISQGVNKIILMAHLQVLANEKLLATKLSGVDIILAAGSNTRLGDADDVAVSFPGHAANFADTYPLVIKDKDGHDTLLVNTDNEYSYLGRLVVDFDENGHIILDSLGANVAINGAYAATDANVAAAWGVEVEDLNATAFAEGTRGGDVKLLTEAVREVIDVKDANIYGYSEVYLEGERLQVRSQETNLGSLSADANGYVGALALGEEAAAHTFIVSLKNGGGIRAQIGTLSAPDPIDGSVDKLPPEGGVSQLDVENSLRFNNQLMMFDTTPEGLKAILEHGLAAGTLQGRFPQIGGVAFSWDPDWPAGERISDIALIGEGYRVNLYNDGVLEAGAPEQLSLVTLSFLANGGDGYPMKANGENFRYILSEGVDGFALSAAVDESLNFTVADSVPGGATPLGEQAAFAAYMQDSHATPESAYVVADTPAELDERIQNLNLRDENVLGGTVLAPGDVLFLAANADTPDAFAFLLTRDITMGTEIGLTDRNYDATTQFAGIDNESAFIWTADQMFSAGTIVTIQPDAENPLADKGVATGAGGGLSQSAETLYAFQGSIDGLLSGGAGEISVERMLASLNLGGGAAGAIPDEIADFSLSFSQDNVKYTAALNDDISALAALVMDSSNWSTSDSTAFSLTNGSLF